MADENGYFEPADPDSDDDEEQLVSVFGQWRRRVTSDADAILEMLSLRLAGVRAVAALVMGFVRPPNPFLQMLSDLTFSPCFYIANDALAVQNRHAAVNDYDRHLGETWLTDGRADAKDNNPPPHVVFDFDSQRRVEITARVRVTPNDEIIFLIGDPLTRNILSVRLGTTGNDDDHHRVMVRHANPAKNFSFQRRVLAGCNRQLQQGADCDIKIVLTDRRVVISASNLVPFPMLQPVVGLETLIDQGIQGVPRRGSIGISSFRPLMRVVILQFDVNTTAAQLPNVLP